MNNITIGGAAEVSGNMSSTSGCITLSKGGSVGGLVSATSVSVGGDASFGQLSTAGTLSANGHTVTLAGDSSMNIIDTAGTERGEGSSSLIVTGGTTAVTVDDQWVNLKSLAISDEARVTFGASLSVADDISTHGTATGTLAEGTKAGLAAKYCIYAGGSIDLAGDLTAGAYVEAKGDISVGGITSVGETTTDDLYLKSINGSVTLTGGGTVVGTVTAKSLSVGADSRLGGLSIYGSGSYDGKLHANGHTVTLTGDATVHAIDDWSNTAAAGSSTLLISGGTTTVRDNSTWTNLKNLALSSEGRMTLAASISVADNITTTTATGTLADGTNAGLESGWCILVGTEEKDGQVKKNTGDVTLAGDLVATNGYLHAMGNVNVSKVDGELGNVSSGDWLTIGGTATVAGDVTAKNNITIGGVANITGKLSSTEGNITLSQGGTLSTVAAAGTVTIGGNSSISTVAQAAGAAQGTSLTITGGNTDLYGATGLHDVSLSGTGSLTIHEYMEASSFVNNGTGELNVIKAFKAGEDLYVREYDMSSDMTVDSIVSTWVIRMMGNDLTIKNGTSQGGMITRSDGGTLTLGGDSSFTALSVGELITHGNRVTVAEDSSIDCISSAPEASQATSLVVTGGTTQLNSSTYLHSLDVAEGASLTVLGNLHIKDALNKERSSTETEDGTLSVSGNLTLEGSASAVAISANSANIASASGAEVVLDAVDFALVTGNATLGNVRLTGDSSIRSTGESQGSISFERLTLVLGEHNSALTPQLATLTLEDEGVVDGLANAATFGIQSDLLQNVNLAEGGDLCIDLSYWADEINRSGLEDVTLTFAEDVNLSNHSALQVTLDGKNYTTATMVDGNVATIAVPEPTTTTLSLLALTVLAARRRRK